MEFKDKVILITGASSGIGKECAIWFAREGGSLAISGRNTKALEEVKETCIQAGTPNDKILVITADMMVDADCKRIVDEAVNHFGRLDVFVNSAGTLARGSVETTSMEDFDNQMTINLRNPFLMTKLVLPHLLETKGNMVHVSSVTGLRAFPGIIAYNVSKAGLDQLVRSLALEVASRGVRVNAVNPGVIMTEVHKRAGMADEDYQKFLEHSKTTHAMGRVGEVSEVASCVLFLASNKASFCTGVTMPIDGGRSIMCPR